MQEDIFKKFNKIKSYNLITDYKQQSLSNSHSSLQERSKKIMHVHQRTPRTPESYFNVPESIALLNIVKSERIQCAFQSNRKNHASVWEMVAGILNKYSNRKRSAKQCCNRYENLKKIYTQLKKNPERHVRRNWPYMYLFREIEEQRGETWGITNKRAATNLLASALNGEGLEPIEIPDLRDINTTGNSLQDHHNIISNHQHHLSNQNHHSSSVANPNAIASSITSNVQSSSNSSSLVASIAAAAAAAAAAAGNSTINHTNNHGNNNNSKMKHEISYYQRRKNMVALTNMLMNREVMLTNLNNNSENSESDRLLPNNFVETELHEDDDDDDIEDSENIDNNDTIMINDSCNDISSQSNNNKNNSNNNNNNSNNNNEIINNNHGSIDLSMFGLRAVHHNNNNHHNTQIPNNSGNDNRHNTLNNHNINNNNSNSNKNNNNITNNNANNSNININNHSKKRNIQEFGLPDFLSNIKDEPVSDHESCNIETDKNGHPEYFMNGLNGHQHNNALNNSNNNHSNNNHNNINNNSHSNNILNSNDITFDPNNDTLSESSNISITTRNNKRRKSSTTETDGGESTNYELIEYLRRREKRDEDMYKRMNDREERLINLLERTVIAFERIAAAAATANIACQQKQQHQLQHQQQYSNLKENLQLFTKPSNKNQCCKRNSNNNIDNKDIIINASNYNNSGNISTIDNINNDNNNNNKDEVTTNRNNDIDSDNDSVNNDNKNNDNNGNNNENSNSNFKSNIINKNSNNNGNTNNSIEPIKILNVASVNKKSIESSSSV